MADCAEYNCPKCGNKMHVVEHVYLFTDPPSVVYECDNCGWAGSPWVSEESIELDNQTKLPQYVYNIDFDHDDISWHPQWLFYHLDNAIAKAKEIIVNYLKLPIESLYYDEKYSFIYTNDIMWLKEQCKSALKFWPTEYLKESHLDEVDIDNLSEEEFAIYLEKFKAYDDIKELAYIVRYGIMDYDN